MESDEEFCLKWNNHHNTLVSVFDTLLKSGTLVDCTIAAGGQYLKAHRVVLSACSPFFELLLSQHGEQHPIVILKDVTFTELQTMIDYMYRGEVNVSQDQLGPLLKAARSLQIKGLSDSGRRGGATTETPEIQATPHTPGEATEQQTPAPVNTTEEDVQPLPRRLSTREGSTSPVPRKRRKHRHKSSGGEEEGGEVSTLQDGHDQTSNSSERSQPVPNTTLSIPAAVSPTPTLVQFTEDEDCKPVNIQAFPEQTSLSQPAILPDQETAEAEVLLEPKSEYVEEEVNEGSVEDLTLDNDENEILSMDHAQPGPSHTEEGPNEGYGPWRFGDDITMSTQETIGAYRDAQGMSDTWGYAKSGLACSIDDAGDGVPGGFRCPTCGNLYRSRHSLYAHTSLVCGKEPRYHCPLCFYKSKIKGNLLRHVKTRHATEANMHLLSEASQQ